ncbi:MAG: IreB family regulatory phosphoprotein [Erysipelotrichaceae bacterium]|nr:IreB family regulatory phosphoprotein [Erysipelotrichaceae bacterium]
MEETKVYSNGELADQIVEKTIEEVVAALRARGYDPINQIVGYLMSGDPGYISNYKEARNKITSIERTRILEVLVKNYIK